MSRSYFYNSLNQMETQGIFESEISIEEGISPISSEILSAVKEVLRRWMTDMLLSISSI